MKKIILYVLLGVVIGIVLVSCGNRQGAIETEEAVVVKQTIKKPFYYEVINDTLVIYGGGRMPESFHIMEKHTFSVAIFEPGITNINEGLFILHNKLNTVFIPNSVIDIGDYVFSHSALTSVYIPENVTNIGMGAFFECHNLTSVFIPYSVTNIGGGAFMECPLTSVTIPNKECEIGQGAFCFCSKLSYVNIGDSIVKYDEKNELFNCDKNYWE
jgi:predicted small secreted protein